jgi:hypothetical protein
MMAGRIVALAAAGLLFAALGTSAQAGTPYTCRCVDGKHRFIGATYACEIVRRAPEDAGVPQRQRRPCTAKEWRSFLVKACAANKCRAPRPSPGQSRA